MRWKLRWRARARGEGVSCGCSHTRLATHLPLSLCLHRAATCKPNLLLVAATRCVEAAKLFMDITIVTRTERNKDFFN